MFESSITRWVVVLFVSILLVCILTGYAAVEPTPRSGVYVGTGDIISAPNNYVGQKVSASGIVLSMDPVQILLTTPAGRAHTITVEGVEQTLTRGDHLSVHGWLTDEHTVVAINSTVKRSSAYVRVRVLSGLAGLWVLYRFLRDWRVRPLLLRTSEGSTIKHWWRIVTRKE